MTTLTIGAPAPTFTLLDDAGNTVDLAALRGQTVVLYFYPKDDTPGCTTQACGFRDRYAEVTDANAVVFGISPDSVASHAKFKNKFSLPFPLLADTDHAVCEAYGVWNEKSMYGKKYMGVTRSHVVIGPDGTLVDVQIKVSPEESVKRAIASATAARS
ncbi:MAG: thioredoxin-dependent thiol peroxidase [Chloroflexi bacterium]|nr:MAG: thioredoxin-dependent thiol peroxidase [Chloroflexota bacterium]